MRFRYPSASTRIKPQDLRRTNASSTVLDSEFWGTFVSVVLVANAITEGVPSAGIPAIGQRHSLATASIMGNAPVVGNPATGQAHTSIADGIAIGTPLFGTPALAQTNALTVYGALVGTPSLGVPGLSQDHTLDASAIFAGGPALGQPGIGEQYGLTAMAILISALVCGTPTMTTKGTVIRHWMNRLYRWEDAPLPTHYGDRIGPVPTKRS